MKFNLKEIIQGLEEIKGKYLESIKSAEVAIKEGAHSEEFDLEGHKNKIAVLSLAISKLQLLEQVEKDGMEFRLKIWLKRE